MAYLSASAQIIRKNPEDFTSAKPELTDNIYSQTGGSSFKFLLSQLDSLIHNHGTGAYISGDTIFIGSDTIIVSSYIGDASGEIAVACSDLTTALTTGTTKAYFRMPYALTVTEVRASVLTAPSGGTLTVDINESGTTILSTKLTIDDGEKTSETAAAAPVISDSALADDAEITIDIDGADGTSAGLIVWIIGTRP